MIELHWVRLSIGSHKLSGLRSNGGDKTSSSCESLGGGTAFVFLNHPPSHLLHFLQPAEPVAWSLSNIPVVEHFQPRVLATISEGILSLKKAARNAAARLKEKES